MEVHSVDLALQELKELTEEQGLMDCDIRSIFNLGLIARHTPLDSFVEKWTDDQKLLRQKSEGNQ